MEIKEGEQRIIPLCLAIKLSNWKGEERQWKIVKSEAMQKEVGERVALHVVRCEDGAVSIECRNVGKGSVWVEPNLAFAAIRLPEKVQSLEIHSVIKE